MFTFHGTNPILMWLVWLLVLILLFIFNEISRKSKTLGFLSFVVLPIILSILWFTVLKGKSYTDWFHLAKVYSATAGCIGFWAIRFVKGKRKDGSTWHLKDYKLALLFPPLILAINILEACMRDIEVGTMYKVITQIQEQGTSDTFFNLMGGSWNYMNAAAGILNIITITGWFGICIRKVTSKDKSCDMIWPDMLWFWILAYDLWNFAYTYNCLPHHSWYCGLALLLAPTLCAFTVGKGAWLQHRAHTLAIWCMFAQTFPTFQDNSMFRVDTTYNPTIYFGVSFLALVANIAVFIYMIIKVIKLKRNPYTKDLYVDLKQYKEFKSLSA